MNNLTLLLVSLLLGIVVTLWVSSYYFRRTVSKVLTPYVQFSSSLFRGVDFSVRDALKIAYKGTPVSDILEIQFLIANTGQRAIRDIISPLTLDVPASCELLDATVLYISPPERTVKARSEAKKVFFDLPLLNSDEFFIVKLLLKGDAKPKDFRFSITVDDLPPILTPKPLPFGLLSKEEKRKFEPALLVIGIIFVILGCSIAGLIYHSWPVLVSAWNTGIWKVFLDNGVLMSSALLSAIPTLLLLVFGVMMCFGSFTNFNFPKRRKFQVPRDFLRHSFRPLRDDINIDDYDELEQIETKKG